MPESGTTNGFHGTSIKNGSNGSNGFTEGNLAEGETFLFTSESVGEGHPGT